MPETSELNHKVNKILRHVESLDNFMPWLIRPQASTIRGELVKVFARRKTAAKVFLAIDDKRTISEIAQFTGILRPNVSAEIKFLTENALVETSTIGNKTICRKSKIDRLLGLTKALEKLMGLPDSNEILSTLNNSITSVKSNNVEEVKNDTGNGDTGSVKDTVSNQ